MDMKKIEFVVRCKSKTLEDAVNGELARRMICIGQVMSKLSDVGN